MSSPVVSTLKRIRNIPPVNRLTTSSVKLLTDATGWRPEWLLERLMRIGPVPLPLPNRRTMTLWGWGDDWITNRLYWHGWKGYEPESTTLFFRLAMRSAVTLDIGAHVGIFSLLASHANPQGRVIAFEPMPEVFARLQRNIAQNRVTNVECVNSAVGETDGTATCYHVKESYLSSEATLSAESKPVGHAVHTSDVPVLRIDTFVQQRQLPRVTLVKIDTETTEPSVIRGMLETIRRDQPQILCEVLAGCNTDQALESLLRPLGYRYYLITKDSLVPKDRIECHLDWRNYLFVPPGGPAA